MKDSYNNNETGTMSRTKRNASLYETIGEQEITNFDVNSNSEVIGVNSNSIDIDKLKDMLDKKYREEPKNKSIGDYDEEPTEEIKLSETREYDINNIINNAKKNKEEDYAIERLKKLHNTETDILEGLNLNNETKVEESKAVSLSEKDRLVELINTINVTEAINKEAIKRKMENPDGPVDPLDLLSDLKGNDDDTKVFTKEDLKINDEEMPKTNIDNSFYTTSNMFKQSDFDDFKDLKEDVGAARVMLKILIAIVIIAFIAGIIFLLNRILGWGLF